MIHARGPLARVACMALTASLVAAGPAPASESTSAQLRHFMECLVWLLDDASLHQLRCRTQNSQSVTAMPAAPSSTAAAGGTVAVTIVRSEGVQPVQASAAAGSAPPAADETGSLHASYFDAGSNGPGLANSGPTNTGIFNSGPTNTGVFDSGQTNTGIASTPGVNTGITVGGLHIGH